MDMSAHPQPATFSEQDELLAAYGVYGDDGALEYDLATIRQRAGDIIVAAVKSAAVRIVDTRASAETEEKIRPYVSLFRNYSGREERIEICQMRFLDLFDVPFSPEWVARAKQSSNDLVANRIPFCFTAVVLSRLTDAALSAVVDHFADDAAFIKMTATRLNRLLAIRLDMLSKQLNDRNQLEASEQRLVAGQAFRGTVGGILSGTLEESHQLRSRTAEASHSTRGMLGKASEVAAAAEQSAVAMREAAQTAAGLIRAIEEARNEVEVAAGVAMRASEESDQAVQVTQALSDHAHAIESILGLIRDIAGQTNLLALNATIEAARAGDAGRGFAVVAQEVKSLASQTARATDDIAAKIGAIQVATRQTVDANGSIRATIGDVRKSAELIRTAMETQAQTVTMITAAVDETALAADAMSSAIGSIRNSTEALAGNIDELDLGFRSVDERLGALESSSVEFVSRLA